MNKDNKSKKKDYKSPHLATVTFRHEVGFGGSVFSLGGPMDDPAQNMEQYNTKEGWGSGGSFWD